MMKILLLFFTGVAYLLPSSNCCLLSNSGECGFSGLSYGGRLSVQVGQDSVGTGPPAPWMDSKVIILQVPQKRYGSRSSYRYPLGMGSRGRLLVTSAEYTCDGSSSHLYCPATENVPCLDSSRPCYMDTPSFSQSEPLEFSEITRTSLDVSWPAWNAETDVGFGPIVEYKILMRISGDSIFTKISKAPAQLSHHFDNLAEGTTYEFQVVIVRDHWHGDGSPSEIQTVLTSRPKPPSYLDSNPLAFSDITSDKITITWPAWDRSVDSGTGPVTGYQLNFREQGGDFQPILILSSGNTLSHTLQDLKAKTGYDVQIRLKRGNENLYGKWSDIQNEETLCGDSMGDITINPSSESIKRRGRAKIILVWQIQQLTGACGIVNQKVVAQLVDFTGDCGVLQEEGNGSIRKEYGDIDNDVRSFNIRNVYSNSLYNVTLEVNTTAGVYYASKSIQTASYYNTC